MDNTVAWINKLNNRELNFLTFVLSHYNYQLLLPANKELIIRDVKDLYSRKFEVLGSIEKIFKSKIIDEDLLNWLKEDTRALLWMYEIYDKNFDRASMIKNKTQASPKLFENFIYNIDASYYPNDTPSSFYSSSVAIPNFNIDIQNNSYKPQFTDINFSLEKKIEYLNSARSKYIEQKTDRKNLIWIDKNNEEQIYWAIDYLKNNGLLLNIRGFLAYTIDDLYNLICASLDTLDNNIDIPFGKQYTQSAHKQLTISKMRKAWSQKKFRDKKDAESAQEYFLTRRHMNKLKKLADEYGLSSKEYLQQLIDDAYNGIE